jgi:hypothetical protein
VLVLDNVEFTASQSFTTNAKMTSDRSMEDSSSPVPGSRRGSVHSTRDIARILVPSGARTTSVTCS